MTQGRWSSSTAIPTLSDAGQVHLEGLANLLQIRADASSLGHRSNTDEKQSTRYTA